MYHRRPSRYSCIRVNTLRSTSDAVIEKLRAILKESSGSGDGSQISGNENVALGENEVQDNPLKGGFRHGGGAVSKCEIPGMEYVVFVWGSGPRDIDYGYAPDRPPKEVIVSRKCAEAVLRGAQVIVFSAMIVGSSCLRKDVLVCGFYCLQ